VEFEAKFELFQQIATENGFESSNWSIYEVTEFTSVPFPKAKMLYYVYFDWEPAGLLPFRLSLVKVQLQPNATWLDLWRAAGEAIRKSRDEHHIFIEGFRFQPIINAVLLSTGS
jgi:hypothetical protein